MGTYHTELMFRVDSTLFLSGGSTYCEAVREDDAVSAISKLLCPSRRLQVQHIDEQSLRIRAIGSATISLEHLSVDGSDVVRVVLGRRREQVSHQFPKFFCCSQGTFLNLTRVLLLGASAHCVLDGTFLWVAYSLLTA